MNFEAQNAVGDNAESIRTMRRQVSRRVQSVLCLFALLIFTSGCWSDHWANWQGVNWIRQEPIKSGEIPDAVLISQISIVSQHLLTVSRSNQSLIISTPGPFTLQQSGDFSQWLDVVTGTNYVIVPMTNGITVYGLWLQCDPIADGVGINVYIDGQKYQQGATTNFFLKFSAGEHSFYATTYDSNGDESPKSNIVLASGNPICGSLFYRAKYQ